MRNLSILFLSSGIYIYTADHSVVVVRGANDLATGLWFDSWVIILNLFLWTIFSTSLIIYKQSVHNEWRSQVATNSYTHMYSSMCTYDNYAYSVSFIPQYTCVLLLIHACYFLNISFFIQAYEEAVDELKKECERGTTRENRLFALMDSTFEKRRQCLLNELPMIHEVLDKFPAFRKPRCVSHTYQFLSCRSCMAWANIYSSIHNFFLSMPTLQLIHEFDKLVSGAEQFILENFNKLTSSAKQHIQLHTIVCQVKTVFGWVKRT